MGAGAAAQRIMHSFRLYRRAGCSRILTEVISHPLRRNSKKKKVSHELFLKRQQLYTEASSVIRKENKFGAFQLPPLCDSILN